MTIRLLKESDHFDFFWRSKFLSYIQGYRQECSTILEQFNFVPEHERDEGDKVFWQKARFNACGLLLPSMGSAQRVPTWPCQEGLQYLLPCQCVNRHIDMRGTIINAEPICRCFFIDESKAQQIVRFILWRVERLSRLLSRWLRHDPKKKHP